MPRHGIFSIPYARHRFTIWISPRQCDSLLSNRLKDRHFRENNVRPRTIRTLSLALAAFGLLSAAAPAMAQEKKITVWFGKGFYKSEDDALLESE